MYNHKKNLPFLPEKMVNLNTIAIGISIKKDKLLPLANYETTINNRILEENN